MRNGHARTATPQSLLIPAVLALVVWACSDRSMTEATPDRDATRPATDHTIATRKAEETFAAQRFRGELLRRILAAPPSSSTTFVRPISPSFASRDSASPARNQVTQRQTDVASSDSTARPRGGREGLMSLLQTHVVEARPRLIIQIVRNGWTLLVTPGA
mgnify:CR=1 FL=1